jgi:multidrug resistance efflux pump
VNDVRSKLNNSQTRVEDNLNEMTRNTTSYLDSLLEELNANSKKLLAKLETTEIRLEQTVIKYAQRAIDEVSFAKIYLDDKLAKTEVRLNGRIDAASAATAALLGVLSQTFVSRTHDIENSINSSEKSLLTCTVDSSNTLGVEVKSVQSQAAQFQIEIHGLHAQVVAIQEQLDQRERELQAERAAVVARLEELEEFKKEKEMKEILERQAQPPSLMEATPVASTSSAPVASSESTPAAPSDTSESKKSNPWGMYDD